jgi:hypothetical protein
MVKTPNSTIAELGPISDAIKAFAAEKRVREEEHRVDEDQYRAGQQRAELVNEGFDSNNKHCTREIWFAATSNKPIRSDSSWFIRGYWNKVAELLSGTPEHIIRG